MTERNIICTHQAGPLCAGPVTGTMQSDETHEWETFWTMEGRVVACPRHGIEFDITTDRALYSSKLKVREYAVSVVDDEVRITL